MSKINEKAIEGAITADKAVAVAADQLKESQIELNQMLGRIQGVQAISSMLEGVSLTQIKSIKESKRYRDLAGQTISIDNQTYKMDTWEGFCRAIGSSRRNIDEKLENLEALGEEALIKAEAMGLSTRTLRKLRKVDSDDQELIINEIKVNAGDKEEIIDLISDLAQKHVKEKTELAEKLKDAQADAVAADRVSKKKNEKIDELEKLVFAQESVSIDDKVKDCYQWLGVAELDCLTPLIAMDNIIAQAILLDDSGLIQRATALLMNIRNHVDDLFVKNQLEHVDLNRELDDSWKDGIENIPEDKDPLGLGI